MKRNHPPAEHAKFHGNLRHYHRSGSQEQRTWDDWVQGVAAKPRNTRNWPKILGISVGLLVLGGIVTGLLIELS